MPFDLAGARREGYADKDILSYLAGRDGIVPEYIPGSDEEKIQELLRRRQAKMLPYEYSSGAPDSGSPGTPVTPRAQQYVPPAPASAAPRRQMSPAEINALWSEQGIQPTVAPVSLLDLAMEGVGSFADEADVSQYLLPASLLGLVRYKRPGVSAAARETAEAYHRKPAVDPVALRGSFEQSQARDPIGRPVRVYHGTNQAFEGFSPDYISAEPGFFFTDSPRAAGDYAASKHRGMGYGPGANIRPTYLDMRNPMVLDMQNASKETSFDNVISRARARGKDGVIVRNVDDSAFDNPFGGMPQDVYIAFSPEQIHPAHGRPFRSLRDLAKQKAGQLKSPAVATPPSLPQLADNYIRPLSEYAPVLYRETSPQGVMDFLEYRGSDPSPVIHTSNVPHLALGQAGNKGVMVEMDSSGLSGQVNTRKPTWEHSYGQGEAEFEIKNPKSEDLRNAVRSVTIKPEALKAREGRAYVQRIQNLARSEKWQVLPNPDGSITYLKPRK